MLKFGKSVTLTFTRVIQTSIVYILVNMCTKFRSSNVTWRTKKFKRRNDSSQTIIGLQQGTERIALLPA